jgi:hypothetical protein
MSIDVVNSRGLVSWGSHIFKIDSERIVGLTKISSGGKRTRTHGYGMSRAHAPLGMTNGKWEPETVKVTLHRHAWSGVPAQGSTGLMRYLSDKVDGRSFGNAIFDMLLQVSEASIASDMQWLSCSIVGDVKNAEENPDPNMVEIEIMYMRYLEDGQTLFDSSEEVL